MMNSDHKQAFKDFLEEFCRHHNGEVTQDDPIPMRFLSNYLTLKEVEAECIDWVLQYLSQKCPRLLACHIARTTADHILMLDLQQFIDNEEDEDDNVEKACEAKTEITLEPETVLLVSSLAPIVFTRVHAICAEWESNLPEHILNPGAGSPVIHHVSTYAIKNSRRKMEDRHVILPYLGELYKLEGSANQSYIGVFDGHGGLHASIYAAAHFHDNLVKHPEFKEQPASALRSTFLLTDDEFCRKANRESLSSGSTGVCALLRDSTLHVAWLGDSEALLVKDGRPITLVSPHKPERQDEKARIESLGGFVEYRDDVYRVNGFISVARAIGDRNLKPYLCADADSNTVELDGSEDYLVLACDGLWDTVTHNEIVEHVYQHIQESNNDKSSVAQMLVNLARDQGSEDNITIVVVFFQDKISPPNVKLTELLGKMKGNDSADSEKKDWGTEKKDSKAGSSDRSQAGDRGAEGFKSSSGSGSKNSSDISQKPAGSGTLHSKEIINEDASADSTPKCSHGRVSVPHSTKEQLISLAQQLAVKDTLENTLRHIEHLDISKEKSSTYSLKSSTKAKSSHSDTHSGGSNQSNLELMTQSASRCLGNRRGRRGRNGRRRNNHRDARRASRESQCSGVALRTNGNGPTRTRSSSESKAVPYDRASHHLPTSKSSGEHMFHMIMGCNPKTIHRAKSQNRWTVAVEMEIESASAMFDDIAPTGERMGRPLSKN